MALRITEFFGREPLSKSAQPDVLALRCPFTEGKCIKPRHGACSLAPPSQPDTPIIACPNRLYAENYKILSDIADRVFGFTSRLVKAKDVVQLAAKGALKGNEVAVFGKYWGQELPLRRPPGVDAAKAGNYYMDWILARVDVNGDLVEFFAVEVQTIDTTGNYREQADSFFARTAFVDQQGRNPGYSNAGMNWENVNKRILPQLIYKSHVLRREQKCAKGLFFVCPRQVLDRVRQRFGGTMQPYVISNGTITFRSYEAAPLKQGQKIRELAFVKEFITTVDEVARALTFPTTLPDMGAYEAAINSALKS